MKLSISKNIAGLSIAAADWMVDYIRKTLQKQDRFTLVLSGGSTPKKLHELLAGDTYKNKIAWSKIHIFFGDERFVPFNDERNNAKMAFDTLLSHVPVAKENIHIIQTENISPEDAAKAYQTILKQYFPAAVSFELQAADKEHPASNTEPPTPGINPQTFDLVLLGMGDDGHTLSLFPGKTTVIHETDKLCTSLWLESQNMYRITLTHPIVNQSAAAAFLAAGAGKATVLKEVLQGEFNPDLYPSQIIKPAGELYWFVDEAAAAEL